MPLLWSREPLVISMPVDPGMGVVPLEGPSLSAGRIYADVVPKDIVESLAGSVCVMLGICNDEAVSE